MVELVTVTVWSPDGHDCYSRQVGDLGDGQPMTKERAIELATQDASKRFEENIGNKGLIQRIIVQTARFEAIHPATTEIVVDLPAPVAAEPATIEVR